MNTIDAATTGTVNYSAISGAAAVCCSNRSRIPDKNVTIYANVAQLKAINGATTGAITLDVTNGALSDAADLLLPLEP